MAINIESIKNSKAETNKSTKKTHTQATRDLSLIHLWPPFLFFSTAAQ